MADIFKCKEVMPPKDKSPDVVRTAQTPAEFGSDFERALVPNHAGSVNNVTRPRFGHGY